MRPIEETLEFNRIKEKIASYCVCKDSKDHILTLDRFINVDDLYHYQELLDQAMKMIYSYSALPISHFENNQGLFQKVKKDGVLYGEEFLLLLSQLNNVKEILAFLDEIPIDDNTLISKIKELVFLRQLYQRITRCIDPSGNIYDHASPALKQIRRSLLGMEASMRRKIEEIKLRHKDYLTQDHVATRNNHLVLPVKSSYKNRVSGMVHAMSSSGQTIFIEPDELIQMNHQYFLLQEQEKQEIHKILKELSQLVKNDVLVLENNQEILISLDELFAKAKYAVSMDAIIPKIEVEGKHILLKRARHPLIDKTQVVANDIELTMPQTIFLISGTNTGGKTVVLKTVGLMSLMALCGLAISCNQAIIPFFDQIFVDLGDGQSIEQSLSTFSSHMQQLVEITSNISEHSLVLLDEIGSGTDPREGESLAQAILDYLHLHHAMTFVSTHYSSLKQYAKKEDFIKISAVEFDQENLKPTYRLIDGSVGNSYAIEISTRLGLHPDIVTNAIAIKESNMSESDHLLERLQHELSDVLKKEEQLLAQIDETNQLKLQYQNKIEDWNKKREKRIQESKQEANQLLEAAKKQIDEVVDELKKQAELKPHLITKAKHDLDTQKHDLSIRKEKDNHVYQVGDRVIVESFHREGEIIDINRKGTLIINMDGLRINAKSDEVSFIGKKKKEKKIISNVRSIKKAKSQSYELNIIGKRYEEAMLEVDKFLDNALLQGYSMVRIVHGLGTGALKNGVRNLLKKNKNVVKYRDGGPNEGGLGATLVYFE